jgi:hypothetical protein
MLSLIAFLAIATFPPIQIPAAIPPTPAPYHPLPCALLIGRSRLMGQPVTRHTLAVLFETALNAHGDLKKQPQVGDVGEALMDFAECVVPQRTQPVNQVPAKR